MDYRGLNKMTIKDIFPIPLIEELFDEFEGVKIFKRLNLQSTTIRFK